MWCAYCVAGENENENKTKGNQSVLLVSLGQGHLYAAAETDNAKIENEFEQRRPAHNHLMALMISDWYKQINKYTQIN